ncbi:hypothetical protein F4778DRAFT_52571 [Xylariomycetidae sp. FL2044]|nr:hypothetical protein F4778DRAFT_52571 [Xylariomycetidae sp. FL2044]
MPSSSNKVAYGGVTLHKEPHRFSDPLPTDQEGLSTYRLSTFVNGPDSTPYYSSTDTKSIEESRVARTTAELRSIVARIESQ